MGCLVNGRQIRRMLLAAYAQQNLGHQTTGHAVVGGGVPGGIGQNHIGISPADGGEDRSAGLGSVLEPLVLKAQEPHLGIVSLGSFQLLGFPDGGSFVPGGDLIGAGIAGGGQGDEDLMALLVVLQKGSCTQELHIVGMGAKCQNIHNLDLLKAVICSWGHSPGSCVR